MNVIDYVKYLLPEGLYSITSMIYLFFLNALNKRLLSINFDNNPFELLSYEGYNPVKFFVMALILFIIGVCLMFYRKNCIRDRALSFGETVATLIALVIILVFLVLIFSFIDNPILKAVLLVLGIGAGLLYGSAK